MRQGPPASRGHGRSRQNGMKRDFFSLLLLACQEQELKLDGEPFKKKKSRRLITGGDKAAGLAGINTPYK